LVCVLDEVGLHEADEVGDVGADVEAGVVGAEEGLGGKEADVEVVAAGGTGGAGGDAEEEGGVGAKGEVCGAAGEAGLAVEERNAGAAALDVAVSEDGEDAALADVADGLLDAGDGGRDGTDAGGFAAGLEVAHASCVGEGFDEGGALEAGGGEGADDELGVADVGAGDDDAVAAGLGLAEEVESFDVEAREGVGRGHVGEAGHVDVIGGVFLEDALGGGVELGGLPFRVEDLQVGADGLAASFGDGEGEGAGESGEGVEPGGREEPGEGVEEGEGACGDHAS